MTARRRKPRQTTCVEDLAAALRAHAAGVLCAVAAVELLIGHAMWLRRNDFVDGFVHIIDESVAEVSLAWVDWDAAVRTLEAGRLPCSGSEAGLLRLAASVAEGIPIDLGEVLVGLDERNLALVTEAVLRAGGTTVRVDAGAAGDGRR